MSCGLRILLRSGPDGRAFMTFAIASRRDVLEQCDTERDAVARHFVALATYLGHVDIKHTYWYLQATPELMTDIAAAAETLIMGEAHDPPCSSDHRLPARLHAPTAGL